MSCNVYERVCVRVSVSYIHAYSNIAQRSDPWPTRMRLPRKPQNCKNRLNKIIWSVSMTWSHTVPLSVYTVIRCAMIVID